MKLLSFKKENLKTYLENSAIDEGNLLIKKDGTIISSNLKSLKDQVLAMQISYLENQNHETIAKTPFIEWHPYINDSSLNERILLLGTFPPPSYLIPKYGWDENPKLKLIKIGSKPEVDYFYGNMSSLWKILNIDIDGLDNLKKRDKIIKELKNKGIGISDIILACQRKHLSNSEKRSSDNNLLNIVPNFDVINKIFDSKKIERIVFTSANWDMQKKGKIDDKKSTMGYFLKSIYQSFQMEIKLNNIWINPIDLCNEDTKHRLYLKYRNQDKVLKFKAPNFLEIRIHHKGQSKNLILIGLPSPSRAANTNLKNTAYFKLWKKYTENKKRVFNKENYRTELYRLAFSNSLEDLSTLFEIQSTNIIDE